MGEVYRARDSKLGREVAIKILPQRFASEPDRPARFEREARLLAALNHPNIGAIYGVVESAGTRGLVLEFVDGETLAERLQRGPVPVAETLVLARAIADALEAAHERGIIHRDLKPANIKITSEGTLKVLDFGLAKAAAPQFEIAPSRPAPGTPEETREGLLLGTPAYMSPEQARGKIVDRRTDLWAFGCLLYEMLTAQPAFDGETPQDTLAAIIEREPDLSRLPKATPPGLRRLLVRCLVKDARFRLRDMGDARLEFVDATTHADERVPTAGSTWWRGWQVVPWIVAAMGLASAAWLAFGRPDVRRENAPTPAVTLEQLTYDSGLTTTPAMSSDGQLLAYASDRTGRGDLDIWVRQTDGGAPPHRRSRGRADARLLAR